MSAKAPVMRFVGSIAAVALLASTGAQAADALIPTKARPFIAAYDWSGLYVGGQLGAGFSYRNWTLGEGSLAEAGDAAMLGGQIGYNYQVGKWVIGIEGDAAWGKLKDEGACPDGINTCWTRQSWLATATGRIGYAFDPALFYLKGGAAFTRADYFKTAPILSPLDEKGGGSRTGWTAGVGMDYALWHNWSVRLEYDYLDFGSRAFAMNNIATGAFAENATVRLKAHEVKLGLNYLFNAGNFTPIVWPAPSGKKTNRSLSAWACRRRSIRRPSQRQIGHSAEVSSSACPIRPSVR